MGRSEPAPILATTKVSTRPPIQVIGHGARQLTIAAQQVRALTLVWELNASTPLAEKTVVIVGGGIAGVTAAAAARLHGATVVILEEGPALLHLQRGCTNRYLHPHIYDWPIDSRARQASAGLPILNWSVDTADGVADKILADYLRIDRHSPGPPTIVRLHVRNVDLELPVRWTVVGSDGSPPAPPVWRTVASGDGTQPERLDPPADVVILAVGFGIERSAGRLPVQSYWRVDPVAQSPVEAGADPRKALVVGTGDGGIIDMLRARLEALDHGSFLDECTLRLQDEDLRNQMIALEDHAAKEAARGVAGDRSAYDAGCRFQAAAYEQMYKTSGSVGDALDDAAELLHDLKRENVAVTWAGRVPEPADVGAQPLNRLLGWLMCREGLVDYIPGMEVVDAVLLAPHRPDGLRYRVRWKSGGVAEAHDLVLRIGRKQTAIQRSFPQVYTALQNLPAAPVEPQLKLAPEINRAYRELRDVRCPVPKRAAVEEAMKLRAKVESRWDGDADDSRPIYRIAIWADCSNLITTPWLDYELHPEYGAVHRRARRNLRVTDSAAHPLADPPASQPAKYLHWVNTRDDYWVRARGTDGIEIGNWLSNMLQPADGSPAELDKFAKCRANLRRCSVHAKRRAYWRHPWSRYEDEPPPPGVRRRWWLQLRRARARRDRARLDGKSARG
ncbi:FAD-binding protein [Pseudonocardia sp. DLS-67]